MKTRSDDLEILIAVVDAGGFSSAAEMLEIQVAKVSRAVTRIESQLGITILNRTTRRVELTEEGRQFVDKVRLGLATLNSAEEEVVSRGELPKGKLRVDAASPFIFHQLIPLIKGFKQNYPDIELELTSNEGFVDLLEKKTDIAIRIGKLTDSTLHARSLGKSELFIVASKDYLATRGVPTTREEIEQHDLLGFSGVKVLNHWPIDGGLTIQPTFTASNGETVRQMTLDGNGISCLSGFMVKKDIEEGRLVALFEQNKTTNTGRELVNAVYYKSSNLARRITAFIDYIQPRLTL
ncbi:LysR family transcriptional regulator [Vibrio agarivorans]|uniref:LysR family transcriptional regulator n=1 Tax=Vibrio agarivorans TaxID=153622 RepID=A0ABT7Y5V1_9VIBR|nr:LysR family transcriptional regulator [Vibrio agarivorans]MDN2483109.1 LysR family transcriptional regulator [Vibrio agarivorans]